jgi:CheY-like chemotaxis protein
MSEQLRILVVDDQRDAADGLARLLSAMGHPSLATYNALEALVQAKDFAPDVVILDIRMPGFSGYDLVGELSKRHPQTVLVALTGLPMSEVKADGGFDHILTKPADAGALRELLATIARGDQAATSR